MIEVIQGDCLEIMKGMEDNSVDLVLTDIPYGEVNQNDDGGKGIRSFDKGVADDVDFSLQELLCEIKRIVRGTAYIFCGNEQCSEIHKFWKSNKLSPRYIIWKKSNPSPIGGEHTWLSGIEMCVYVKKPGSVFNEHCKNTVLTYSSGSSKIHPTQKPIDLFRYLINVSSNDGMKVLDCFAGSGTTGVACKELGRDCILIEKEPKYIEVINKRLANTTVSLFH